MSILELWTIPHRAFQWLTGGWRDGVGKHSSSTCQTDVEPLGGGVSAVLQKYLNQEVSVTPFCSTIEGLSVLMDQKAGSVQVGIFVCVIQCSALAVSRGPTSASLYHFEGQNAEK